MAKIHVLIGIPGSGKSTYAKRLQERIKSKIVSSDTVRNNHPDWKEELIFPEVYRLCASYLKDGIDVIYDATSITPNVRNRLVNELLPYDVSYERIAYYFPISYEDCYKRISLRNENPHERFFPLEALKSYSERIIAPSVLEGFDSVYIIEQTKLSDISSKLLENIVIDNEQGYAFYYEDERGKVEAYQGYQSDTSSNMINSDTNFRLASVSKQFIGLAIYELIKSGKLSYDTCVNDIINLGKYAKDITIKNLLTHTSGILDYEDMDHTEEQIHDIDVVKYLQRQDHVKFSPNSEYSYSNSAFVLLGLIIEKVSKRKINEYIESEIFAHIGMNDSKVNIQGVTDIKNRAYGHQYVNGELVVKDQYWCSATIGDGGLYSSVTDLKKWLDYLMSLYKNNQAKYADYFKANILNNGENSEYGFGIRHIVRKGIDIIYHCGSTIGTNTIIGFIPSENKKFIFLTNFDGIDTSKFIDNLVKII